MQHENALTHAVELIKRQSVTPEEGGALDYLQDRLEALGFKCHRLPFSEAGTPDVDNLYARIGDGAPHICFAGHTDVVPAGDVGAWRHPPFEAVIDDGVLYGRGAADMKGGVACFLAAVEDYLAVRKRGKGGGGSISFLITGDEEGPAINGTVKMLDWLLERGETIDHCLVGEPTNPAHIGEMIKIGRRGSLNTELTIIGKQGHVAYQHLALNPIEGLAKVIGALLDEPLDNGTDTFMPSNLEFTNLFVPDNAVNIIPGKAVARFNIRFNDAHTPASLRRLIRDRVAAALRDTDFTAQMEFNVNGDSFVTHSPQLVQTLAGAIRKVTGRTPELSTTGGTSDARFIKNHCPVIEFGLVNATIHQINEQTPVRHLQQLSDIYARFLEDYFKAGA